jgi:MFS family permease
MAGGGASMNLVDPNPTFSSSGMCISSVDGPWKMTTIESANTFSLPLTLQAVVKVTQGGGGAFTLWLRNEDVQRSVGFDGVFNVDAPNYGIWSDYRGNAWYHRIYSSPQLNTEYQLKITVDASGEFSLTLSSNGQTLGSVIETTVGTGHFRIILAQYEISADTTGVGPNQAYWKSVAMTSSETGTNPSPKVPPVSSPTPNSTQIFATVSPTPITSSNSATQGAVPTTTSSSSASPTGTNGSSLTPNSEDKVSFPLEVTIAIAAPTIALAALLVFRFRKTKKGRLIAPTSEEAKSAPSKLFLLGLLAAVFSVEIIDLFVPLFRPEIARTFGISTATAFQISAFNSIAAVITGLALSAFSIRIRYKYLLTLGTLCTLVCTIGVFLAPTFLVMQAFYTLNGVGSVIVGIIAPTLIGELYPYAKKATRISWIMATGQLAAVIGSPILGLIAGAEVITSWRSAVLWFEVPATLICLLLVIMFVPNSSMRSPQLIKKEAFMNGFKQVLTNKSAVACLVFAFLGAASTAINAFAPAFVAEVFNASLFMRSTVIPETAFSFLIAGLLIGGLLVNRVGRKRLAVAAGLPTSIFVFLGFPVSIWVPNIWVYLSFRFTAGLMGGMLLVAGSVLALDQVPKYRGTMMSLFAALGGMGGAFAFFLGSTILDYIGNPVFGYPVATVTLGILGITANLIILFLAKEPVNGTQKING